MREPKYDKRTERLSQLTSKLKKKQTVKFQEKEKNTINEIRNPIKRSIR